MKKTFRFMAMAVAAIVMAGITVACDPMDKDDEKQEQTGDNTENEGTENGGGLRTRLQQLLPLMVSSGWLLLRKECQVIALTLV